MLRDDNPRTGPRRSVVTAFAEDDGQILPAADYFDSVCMVDRSFTVVKQRCARQITVGDT